MFKFRTMEHEKRDGIYLTRAGDMRITRVGRLLRKWKSWTRFRNCGM